MTTKTKPALRGRPKKLEGTAQSIGVRMSESMIKDVDNYVKVLRKELGPGWQLNRGDALRALVTIGLKCTGKHEESPKTVVGAPINGNRE